MTNSTNGPPAEATGLDIHPADILMNLIISILAPMFLTASDGNVSFARMAAMQTVNAYRARNHADLLAIAQIIGFGLAALGSLSLSMTDNLSLSMTLRLRGTANALNRSAEQNRRVLKQSLPGTTAEAQVESEDQYFNETEIVARVAETQKLAEAARSRQCDAAPATPQPPAPTPSSTLTDRQRQTMWGTAMANVAAELTADLANVPPAERRIASVRAAALSSTANALISGTPLPPSPPQPDPRHPNQPR